MSIKFKPFLSLFFLPALLFNCQENPEEKKEHYIISGVVDSLSSGRVILSEFNPLSQETSPIDTTLISAEGTYQLEFELRAPNLFQVDFSGEQIVPLAIDIGQKKITLNVEGRWNGMIKLDGSSDSQKLLDYEQYRIAYFRREIFPIYDKMIEALGNDDHDAEVEAAENYIPASTKFRTDLIKYTKENIGTSIALYWTMRRWSEETVAIQEQLVKDFQVVHPDLEMTKIMTAKITRFKNLSIGEKAPNFELPDSTGTFHQLKTDRGKITLIDFWSSWCRPCWGQFPELKATYSKYQDKGFEIIGVSVDDDAKKWREAIQKYEVDWMHLSDIKGWASPVAIDYNVTILPFNFLIDENGRIIAKNFSVKELTKQLEALLE